VAKPRDSYRPPRWPAIIPRIVVSDAAGLVEFVKGVFGATGTYRDDGPTELTIGDSILMITSDQSRHPVNAFLYVYVPDTDEVYRRAIQTGAVSLEKPAEMPYGDRRAMIRDGWGNTWQIATHRGFRR
jgi:PhnB protein